MDWHIIFNNSLAILGHGTIVVFPYTIAKSGFESHYTPPNIYRKIKCHIYWLIASAFISIIIAKGFDEFGFEGGLNRTIPYFIAIYFSAALGLNEAIRLDNKMTASERSDKILQHAVDKRKSSNNND